MQILDPYKCASQNILVETQVLPEQLPRLQSAVQALAPVQVSLHFSWGEQRRLLVSGTAQSKVTYVCQRCMQEFESPLVAQVNAAVVWNEQQEQQLPADLDGWLGENEKIALDERIEDEMLLALPFQPVHDETQCSGLSYFSTEVEEPTPSPEQKPFADLAALLKNKQG